MSAELNVALKLQLDGLQQQAQAAAAIIKQQLGAALQSGGGGTSPVSKQTEDVQRLTRQVQAGTVGVHALGKALKNLGENPGVRMFSKGGTSQGTVNLSASALARNPHLAEMLGGGVGSDKPSGTSLSEKAAKKAAKDLVTFQKDMSFLMMPLFNPGSVWATLFSTRQTYSALNTEHGKSLLGSKMGGMSPLAGTAALVGGATALGLALKALTTTVQQTIAAYERARQLYAKSLMSGLGLNLTVKRGMMASIMGVSEEDVLKFGAAMSYLNPKIEWASGVLARTTPELTRVAWEFDVLKVNLQAMFSLLASEGATSLTNFTAGLSVLIKLLSDSWITRMGAGAISGIASTAVGAMTGGSGLGQLLAKLGFKGISEIGKLSGSGGSSIPSPQQFMKTLPASSWEKMGLVIGSSGGVKDLIRESNKYLSEISKAVTGGGGAVPRSFGMSPMVANP